MDMLDMEKRNQEIIRAAAEGREPDFSNPANLVSPGSYATDMAVAAQDSQAALPPIEDQIYMSDEVRAEVYHEPNPNADVVDNSNVNENLNALLDAPVEVAAPSEPVDNESTAPVEGAAPAVDTSENESK